MPGIEPGAFHMQSERAIAQIFETDSKSTTELRP